MLEATGMNQFNSYNVPYLGIASAWVGNTTRYVAQSCLCILSRFNYQ